MKLKQFSLFLENKPGNIRKIYRTLDDHGISIETMVLADTEHYGVLRILVKNWEAAKEVFEKNGMVFRISEVIAVAVDCRSGGLTGVLDILDENGLNVEYMYGFFHSFPNNTGLTPDCPLPAADAANTVVVFRFENPDACIETLKKRNIRIIGEQELFNS
ncbi:MAG: hypothetical protein LBH00_13030 [Planctomycetaceae bacterium]|jgi:hypothetical protein|nr:hypothetical protein [Planctomycetaceae bacterium]